MSGRTKMWSCEVCNKTCAITNKTNHLRTKKHINKENDTGIKIVSRPRGRPKINEEEKRERYLASELRYATKPWTCTNCNITILIGNKTKHLKSKKHFKSLSP